MPKIETTCLEGVRKAPNTSLNMGCHERGCKVGTPAPEASLTLVLSSLYLPRLDFSSLEATEPSTNGLLEPEEQKEGSSKSTEVHHPQLLNWFTEGRRFFLFCTSLSCLTQPRVVSSCICTGFNTGIKFNIITINHCNRTQTQAGFAFPSQAWAGMTERPFPRAGWKENKKNEIPVFSRA